MAFNDKSGFGYSKAVNHSPKDIMSVDVSSAAPSIENLFNSQSASTAFASNDPNINQAPQQDSPTETLMEKLHPDNDYQGATGFKKQDNMRDVNKVVKDGQNIAQRTDNARQENNEAKETLRKDFDTDKQVAVEAMQECAVESGINPNDATDSLVSSGESSKVCATSAIFAEAATGGMGSIATMGKAATVAVVASKEDKKLSPDEQKALLEDTLKQLQSRSASTEDTRMSASTSGGGGNAPLPDSKNEACWENCTADDLKELLASDVEDMPEWEALDEIEFSIDEAQENQRFVAENYGERGDLIAKAEAAAAGGNSAVLQGQLDSAQVHVNAGDAQLAGQSVSGFVMIKLPEDTVNQMAANGATFESTADAKEMFVAVQASDVETRYDNSLINENVVSQELSGFMQKQMQAAFG